MATRFVAIERDTLLLLPPHLGDWVCEDPLVDCLVDAVAALDLSRIKVKERGPGSEQDPPTRLWALLIYSYAPGPFSSRRIQQSTYESVPGRVWTADPHPDPETICPFRRQNPEWLTERFVKGLQWARQLKGRQGGQIPVAGEGPKGLANASKPSAVSSERAGQRIAPLELEVKQLVAKAEQADSAPLPEGLSLPAEIARRQERKAALEKARAEIEVRAQARDAAERAEHPKRRAEGVAQKERGQKVGGRPPQAPTPGPTAKGQDNFTDPESRIMKAGHGDPWEPSDHAPAAVAVARRLGVGQRVSPSANDQQALAPAVPALPAGVGTGAAG